jgi:microcin C transport system substrate-binding protein
MRLPLLKTGLSSLLFLAVLPVLAGHGWAQFGELKQPAGFAHFAYADPQASKGGEIALVPPTRLSQYDKFNPFTLKGQAPPGLASLLLETLLTGTLDEPNVGYGLLADDVSVAADGLSAIFRLNPKARFHDGSPVLAADVRHSFETLTSQHAAPQYRSYFADIRAVVVLGERLVRFDFAHRSAELPLIAGSLPVFSRRWGGSRLDQVIMEPPIGSGPYRLEKRAFGRDVSYRRDPDWWAADLNVRRGHFNFDRISYRLYQDSTAQLEAFKAGEFDYIQAFIAREWARAYRGGPFERGLLVKEELPNRNAGDFQGFLFNTRLKKFSDPRVREAIGLALDFEWMNRQLFFNAYARVRGYFVASDFEARALPGADELALLDPWRQRLPAAVFGQPVPLPPVTSLDSDSGHTLRNHLRRARDLLAQAGWTYRDGALRNAAGEPFTIEFLDNSAALGRVFTPFAKNLEKLGIEARHKVVDFALLQKRLDTFDFELISSRSVGSEAPGAELLERFGSRSAAIQGSSNLMGVRDPVVDALAAQAAAARTRPQLVAALRALDRVLRHGHYSVPHWYGSVHRIAWRAGRFERPPMLPTHYQPEAWVLSTWWASAANRAGR